MSENETLYGQHSRQTLALIAAACVVVGLIIGVFLIPPDALPLGQRIAVGLFTGVWGTACLYGWRFLYLDGDEVERDEAEREQAEGEAP